MTGGFTKLELAALHAIFAETPELSEKLERQVAASVVTDRENTGHGFFTSIAVGADAPRVAADHLGKTTHAKVVGLDPGMGFVLFLKEGLLHTLEGYAFSPDDTTPLDLADLEFSITNDL